MPSFSLKLGLGLRYAQHFHRRHYRIGGEHDIKVSELVPERRRFLP
jgi:hypothetical protein